MNTINNKRTTTQTNQTEQTNTTQTNSNRTIPDRLRKLSLQSPSWIAAQLHSRQISEQEGVAIAISKLLALARVCGLRLELQRSAFQGCLDEVEDDLLRMPNRRKGRFD